MENARREAVKAIVEILGEGMLMPKAAMERHARTAGERDRAFINELVLGVVRYRDTIDWMLRRYLKNPDKLSPLTLNNIRMSIYQLRFMRVPDYAVVNEAVAMEKPRGRPDLVNAVLRGFLRNPMPKLPAPKSLTAESIAVSTSHPIWLVKRWKARFGGKRAYELASANNKITPPCLNVKRSSVSRKVFGVTLKSYGINNRPADFSPDGIRLFENIPISRLEALREGFFIQDEAAQLAALLLNPIKGDSILDLCSAPGGKAMHTASITNDESLIVAVESGRARLDKIADNIHRLGLTSIKLVCADVLHLPFDKPFDKIILDPPCSSMGVIRKNPDIKYRHTEADLIRFASMQSGLLESSSRLLKSGGTLLYSVCSTEPEEGEGVVNNFLHNNPDFYIIKGGRVGGVEGIEHFETGEGFYRTFPDIHDMDGFFYALISRR